jgi:hypothetical protein
MIGRGLGLITSSSFYAPQVNLPGSMASFVTINRISQCDSINRSACLLPN